MGDIPTLVRRAISEHVYGAAKPLDLVAATGLAYAATGGRYKALVRYKAHPPLQKGSLTFPRVRATSIPPRAGYKIKDSTYATIVLCEAGKVSFWNEAYTTRYPSGAGTQPFECIACSALDAALQGIPKFAHTYAPRQGACTRARRGRAGLHAWGGAVVSPRQGCSARGAGLLCTWSPPLAPLNPTRSASRVQACSRASPAPPAPFPRTQAAPPSAASPAARAPTAAETASGVHQSPVLCCFLACLLAWATTNLCGGTESQHFINLECSKRGPRGVPLPSQDGASLGHAPRRCSHPCRRP